MIERDGRAGDRVRRRRIHRPLRLRSPARRAASGSASPSAIRARPISSSRSAQVGQFGFAQADITNADSVRHARRRRDRGRSTCAACSARRCSARPCRRRAQRRRGGARGGRRRAGPHLRDRRRPAVAVQLRPHQGRGRGGGPQGLPERDDHPPVAGVRARGRSHQPLRRDGAAAVPSGDRGQAQFPAGLCPRPRQGDRHGRARSAALRRQDLRDRRAAGDEHGRASPGDPRDHRPDARHRRRCPTSFGDLLVAASAGCPARR